MNGARNHVRSIRTLIQQQHRELGRTIRGIDLHFAKAVKPGELLVAVAEAERRLSELRAHLEHHFRQEEEEGFLDEAAAAVPRLSAETARIKHEHVGLLVELDRLLEQIRRCDGSAEAWERAGELFRAFARMMLKHEKAENRILQAGYNEDFDVDA